MKDLSTVETQTALHNNRPVIHVGTKGTAPTTALVMQQRSDLTEINRPRNVAG